MWSNWEAALEGIGSTLQSFRGSAQPDHDGVLDVIKGQVPPQTVERAAFGLPMQFYYRGYHDELAKQHRDWNQDRKRAKRETRRLASANVTPAGREFERRASPLHFKMVRLSNGQLTTVVTFFEARFLKHARVRITPRDRDKLPQDMAAPDYRAVRTFLSQLQWRMVFGGGQ